jgi:uncharacterized protein GlcG (DUF336 family)
MNGMKNAIMVAGGLSLAFAGQLVGQVGVSAQV